MRNSQSSSPWPEPVLMQVDALEKLIRSQLDDHRQMLELITSKREALREADMARISDITERERAVVQRITDVERHRVELVKRLTPMVKEGAPQPLTVTEMAEALGEMPAATRLLGLAAELREQVKAVRKESSIVRAAAESLSRHLNGVMQQVHSAISRARVYSRHGHIAVGAQMDFSVDLKT